MHVTDFKHYLYIAAPVSFRESDCDQFRHYLESQLRQHDPVIHDIQMVMRENLFGFQGNQQNPYLKITVNDPKNITSVRSHLESGGANFKGLLKGADNEGVLTFDNIQYILRFMIDTGVSRRSRI